MATTAPKDTGPIVFVRSSLEGLTDRELTRIAVEADLSLATVRNIRSARNGGNPVYGTVMKLHELMTKRAEAAAKPAKRGRK